MSKLFDALLRDKGSIKDLDPLALVGDQSIPTDPLPEPGPVPPAALPPASTSSNSTAAAQLAPAFEAPAFRTVHMRLPQNSPVLPFGEDQFGANEQYRVLRTKLNHHTRQPRMILVSSAGPGDGKSVTAINLAGALSLSSETRVLLVDGDFRRSSICNQLGIPETPGLAEVLEGRSELHDAIAVTEEFLNLFLLPAGKPTDNPAELLQSSRWSLTAAALRKQFRYVILDSPPIAALADYDLLQSACDGVIVVVRPDYTSRPACKRALESVPKDKLLGVALNCVTDWFLGERSGYGYGAGYYQRSR